MHVIKVGYVGINNNDVWEALSNDLIDIDNGIYAPQFTDEISLHDFIDAWEEHFTGNLLKEEIEYKDILKFLREDSNNNVEFYQN